MNENELAYINRLRKDVYAKISDYVNDTTVDKIVMNDLVKAHIENKVSASFQNYYFATLNNEEQYFKSTDFFRQFKSQYSLQGIDNKYLDRLESNKYEILEAIHDNLVQLYFDFFNKAEIKHGNGFKEKDLGSFFAKLVHTFRPDEFCALDNPIKNYFGLKKESFFISFFIISDEYKHWATENQQTILTIKEKFRLADKSRTLNHDLLTDLKLLDLIFWSKANKG
jgi:hypothetical protein